MKNITAGIQRFSLPILTLIMVLLAACAPAIPTPAATAVATPVVSTQVPSQAPELGATDIPVVATDPPALVFVATSRGPNLEATDPTSVNLASGQLQLVEFFRFT